MDSDDIREHIESAAGPSDGRLTSRILAACWPGGSQDRTEPAARGWLKRWRPAKTGVAVPACSCASGRCAVCN